MYADDARVTYIGPPENGLAPGDQGRVLSGLDSGAHVQWVTGNRRQEIMLVWDENLAPTPQHTASVADGLDDSLEVGTLTHVAARAVYDLSGPTGVLNAMSDAGHLTSFIEIAEEAMSTIASRIRTDPSFRSVATQLDEEEAEEVVRLAAASLVRDAFGSTD